MQFSIKLLIAIAIASRFLLAESLSSKSGSLSQKPIERVAIVGSGIAGLSLAHALTNSPTLADGFRGKMEVSIFESRDSFDYSVGAGVQLNGAIVTLGKINPDIQRAVIEAATTVDNIRGRTKTSESLYDLSLENIIRNAGGVATEELISDGKVMWFAIMRGMLQEILMDMLPGKVKNRVSYGKRLIGIKAREHGGAICEFSDGSTAGPFDCVLGCDGINSAVKEYISSGSISEYRSRKEATIYSGIRIRYAVKDDDPSEATELVQDFRQYFADGAYALSSAYGNGVGRPLSKGAFIVFLDDDYIGPFQKEKTKTLAPVSENVDWQTDNRKPLVDTREEMLDQIKQFNIPYSGIGPIVEKADRFFETGVYFHNPLSFSGWSKEIPLSDGAFAVLCGDAAHAMPPFLGQGANQAVQDSYCLAKKIFDFNAQAEGRWSPESEEDQPKELKKLLKEYEKTRWYPTASITAKAAVLGYLETGGPNGAFAKFRDLFFKFSATVGIASRVLLDAAIPKV